MFVRGSNPIWFFNNLTGQPFDDTYYAFFLENTVPYNPQTVFQDPNGTIPWANPIEFQPSAGLPDNIYGDPTLVYRLEFRQGPTQSDPLIGNPVQNYIFGNGGGGAIISEDVLITSDNMITNPQFADINFVSPITYTLSGTYDIAPGWQLILTGTGSTTITQVTVPGDSDNLTNPNYFLTFNNSGWTSVQLIQKFSNNGAIWSGGAASVFFTGFSTGSTNIVTVSYQPSNGSGTPLISVPVLTGSPQIFKNAVDIPVSTSTDSGTNAFVNIIFSLPATGIVSLSNIQVTGQSERLSTGFDPLNDSPLYHEQTYERTVDQEFHVYKDSLLTQPKENLLVGWTFALNPYQFKVPTISNLSDFDYVADQTIAVQQSYVSSATGNSIATGRGTNAQNLPFVVKGVSTNNQFAIIQYIDPKTIAPYWNQILSSMVNANLSDNNSTAVKFKMRLIYRTTVPPVMTQNEPIASWTLGGEPVFALGWNSIIPLNDPSYTLTTSTQNFHFDHFQLPLSSSDNMSLGIVIYTVNNLDINNSILFNRVSLVPNDYAIEASTETWDETFRKCQFYFETSYISASAIGTNANTYEIHNIDIITFWNPGPDQMVSNIYRPAFSLKFKTIKRIIPKVTYYSSLNGTIDHLLIRAYNVAPINTGVNVNISGFNLVSSSNQLFGYLESDNSAVISFNPDTNLNIDADLSYHYVSDARMGLGIG